MKRNFLKRSLALAVAAAMTISSVPTNVVFAEEPEPIVMVDEIVDGADGSAEEEQMIEASEPVTVEVEEVEPFDTNKVPENAAANIDLAGENGIAPISMADPFQVSNLRIEDDTLKWRADEDYQSYEFDISDGTYSYFASLHVLDDGTKVPVLVSSYYYSIEKDDKGNYATDIIELIGEGDPYYKDAAGVWQEATDVATLRDGVTYTINVRPIGYDENDNRVKEGPWASSAVTYTYTKPVDTLVAPAAPTEFRYVVDEYGHAYLKWNAPATGRVDRYRFVVSDGTYRYGRFDRRVGEDPSDGSILWAFEDTSYSKNSTSLQITERCLSGLAYPAGQIGTTLKSSDKYTAAVKNPDGSNLEPFEAGKKYTVQIYAENSEEDANGNFVYLTSALSDPIEVTVPSAPTAIGKVENLELRKDNDGNEFLSWSKVKVDGYTVGYEIIAMDTENKPVGSSKFAYDTEYNVSELELDIPGAYILQVRACILTSQYVYGEAATVPYTVDSTRDGNKATPKKVTGLVLKTDNADRYEPNNASAVYTSPTIAWNRSDYDESVDRYDIELVDKEGHYYYLSYPVEVDKDTNGRTPKEKYYSVGSNVTSVAAADFADCRAYTLPDGVSSVMQTGADGKILTGFDAGQTYTVRVRAVDEYETYEEVTTKDNNKTKDWVTHDNVGEWSDAKTYQVGTVSAITDLKYVQDTTGRKGNYYFFSYSAVPGATVYYQLSTDPTFAEKNPNTESWFTSYYPYDYDNEGYRLCISKTDLLPNTTYYIRAVNVLGDDEPTVKEADTLMAANPGMVASFTTDAASTPKAITDLDIYEEDADSFIFTFGAVLEYDDSWILQYSKDQAVWKDADTNSSGNIRPSLSKDLLDDGVVYYVRVLPKTYDRHDRKTVEGTPSNVVTVSVNRAAGAVTGFAMKKTQTGYAFSYTNVFKNGERVELQVADSTEFVQNGDRTMIRNGYVNNGDEKGVEAEVSYSELTPGKKYYARARVYSNTAKEGEKYGPWSNIITITPKVAKITVSAMDVGSTELYLKMNRVYDEDYLSGYQIQRKKGKKWTTLVYTTDNVYKDGGLTAETKYQYRVRPYYYNAKAKKKYVYGSYVNCEVMTWGGALNLKAQAKNKTSVKLSWSKVAGADGYEIYRTVMSSESNEVKSQYSYAFNVANSTNGYTSQKLVKTIKKASVKSYTDKKLTSGMRYFYEVRAYKTIGKEKYYIAENATVNLSLASFKLVDVTTLKNGKTKITWSPIYTGKGYLIEKLDNETGEWSTLKTIKKAKTSTYTLPANKTSKRIDYRIRAYDKSGEYSSPVEVYTNPTLKAPKGVKAVAQKDGSIKVTWKKVSGADYYVVYRTTSSYSSYSKDSKTYSHEFTTYVGNYGYTMADEELTNYVVDSTTLSGYRATDPDELTGTVLYDREISYTTPSGVENTIWKGPEGGVQYYYYVRAFKKGEAYIWKNGNWDTSEEITGYSSELATATVVKKALPVPKKVKVKASSGAVKVSWKKVKGAKGYVVYRSTKKKSGYVPVGYISKAKTKSYTDKSVQKGKTYYYKVCAYKISAVGSYQYSKQSAAKKVKAR